MARLGRVYVIGLLALGLVSIAGCSESAPAPMTREAAAQAYLSAVCPANAAFAAVRAVVADWQGVPDPLMSAQTAVLTDASTAIATGAASLRQPVAPWPQDLAADVVAVADDMDAVAAGLDSMADAATLADGYGLWQQSQPESSASFDAVRKGLGLPPDGADNGCPAP